MEHERRNLVDCSGCSGYTTRVNWGSKNVTETPLEVARMIAGNTNNVQQTLFLFSYCILHVVLLYLLKF